MSDNILLKYYTYLKFERNFTDNSVSAYMSDITKLQNFAESKGKTLLTLEQLDIEEFLASLQDIGIEATSQKRILVGARSFYKFARLEKITHTKTRPNSSNLPSSVNIFLSSFPSMRSTA